ncbi:hypothetical protein [Legionella qingyii]|uniref:hypothetical protein n=1 Tax=Legionella qingyii TaxID=2184757 RepID=UPI000F8D2B52|nr:hypothetical protein [Legionella qingyii]RUR25311.1 hypothetical protein ELY16_10290 [Legionella qingyii]
MQSKYEGDMGFDFSIDSDDIQEVNKEESGPIISESPAENNTTTTTSVSPEVSGIPIEEYFDTDYNKFDTDYDRKEQDTQSQYESPSVSESDNSPSSNSSSRADKSGEAWSGAKLLLTPLTFIANIISTSFTGRNNTTTDTEQQSSPDEITPKPLIDDNFDTVDYQKHQKEVGSTNKILLAVVDTVQGAANTDLKECESYEFRYKDREKLHKKTGGTENTEMVGVNVFLDKNGKPLLPGARKSLKEHANAKQQSAKEYNSEIHPPSEAVSHAKKEFEIAHEFGKGDDVYDQAGKIIHTGKGIAELLALDLEQINGGVTSQPGFVTNSPSTAYLMSKIKERSDKALKKDVNTTTSENNDESSSDLSSVKKI